MSTPPETHLSAGPAHSGPPPARADVVVIGGGVIGTSVACHLADAGVRTVLFERGALGSGSSGSTAGVIRTYFPGAPLTSRLAVRSTEAYLSFAERTGTDPGLERVGFMELFTGEQQVAAFRETQADQQSAGVDVELVSPAEAARLNPLLDERTVVGAAWSPEAYACDPAALVRGYATAAGRAGAVLREHTPVTGIEPDGTVHTPAGSVRAGTVVCAAGPWAGAVAQLVGVRLPVTTYPIELLLTDAPAAGGAATGAAGGALPMTLHPTSLRIRRWGERILVGMGRPGPDESRKHWLERVSDQLGSTYPSLAGSRIDRGWRGHLDVSPDGTAFIGHDGSLPFVYAAGFSGQGLCQAPAAGELVRDLVLGKETWADASALATGRCPGWQTGRPSPEGDAADGGTNETEEHPA